MARTDLELPDDLSARLQALAQRDGVTTHEFIVQTITEKISDEEWRQDLGDEADRRYAEFLVTGESIAWEDMRDYMERRLAGERPEPLHPSH